MLQRLSRECKSLYLKGVGGILKNSLASEASFEIKEPFKLHKLDKGPSTTVTLTKEDGMRYYEELNVIRRIETVAGNLYKEKVIRGFCHLYSGQEAVAVGVHAALRPRLDSVITAYRAHGWSYIMGVSALGVLAELTGRKSGNARGKGGSMHMYAKNFYGGNGIVGAQVPLGAGVAFAHRYRADGGVCFALYGDGAANQGQIFEVFNIAKLWSLPCVFVCENNGYAMGTKVERSSASAEYYTRGDYVPGLWVDGMDVLAAREAARFAVDWCASGKGPLVVEMHTYRYGGHSMSDPGTSYRTREEVQEVRQTRDPIVTLRERLLESNLATVDEVKDVETRVRKEIDQVGKAAAADAEIDMSDLAADVYAKNLEKSIRNTTPFNPLAHKSLGKPINLD